MAHTKYIDTNCNFSKQIKNITHIYNTAVLRLIVKWLFNPYRIVGGLQREQDGAARQFEQSPH